MVFPSTLCYSPSNYLFQRLLFTRKTVLRAQNIDVDGIRLESHGLTNEVGCNGRQ